MNPAEDDPPDEGSGSEHGSDDQPQLSVVKASQQPPPSTAATEWPAELQPLLGIPALHCAAEFGSVLRNVTDRLGTIRQRILDDPDLDTTSLMNANEAVAQLRRLVQDAVPAVRRLDKEATATKSVSTLFVELRDAATRSALALVDLRKKDTTSRRNKAVEAADELLLAIATLEERARSSS